jgi:hypothetical protein
MAVEVRFAPPARLRAAPLLMGAGRSGRAAAHEVPLLDSYNADLIPGLAAGQYGASFRFSVTPGGETFDSRPMRSIYNPEGLPERTIREVELLEFRPVTFPACLGATALVAQRRLEACESRSTQDPGSGTHSTNSGLDRWRT